MNTHEYMPPYHYNTEDFKELRKAYDVESVNMDAVLAALEARRSPQLYSVDDLKALLRNVGYEAEAQIIDDRDELLRLLKDATTANKVMNEQAFVKQLRRIWKVPYAVVDEEHYSEEVEGSGAPYVETPSDRIQLQPTLPAKWREVRGQMSGYGIFYMPFTAINYDGGRRYDIYVDGDFRNEMINTSFQFVVPNDDEAEWYYADPSGLIEFDPVDDVPADYASPSGHFLRIPVSQAEFEELARLPKSYRIRIMPGIMTWRPIPIGYHVSEDGYMSFNGAYVFEQMFLFQYQALEQITRVIDKDPWKLTVQRHHNICVRVDVEGKNAQTSWVDHELGFDRLVPNIIKQFPAGDRLQLNVVLEPHVQEIRYAAPVNTTIYMELSSDWSAIKTNLCGDQPPKDYQHAKPYWLHLGAAGESDVLSEEQMYERGLGDVDGEPKSVKLYTLDGEITAQFTAPEYWEES